MFVFVQMVSGDSMSVPNSPANFSLALHPSSSHSSLNAQQGLALQQQMSAIATAAHGFSQQMMHILSHQQQVHLANQIAAVLSVSPVNPLQVQQLLQSHFQQTLMQPVMQQHLQSSLQNYMLNVSTPGALFTKGRLNKFWYTNWLSLC